MLGRIPTDKSRKGDVVEHYVIFEALRRGAEVYKNVGCSGKTDIVLKWNNMIIECDVKTLQNEKGSCYTWKRSMGRTKSTPIGVHPITGEIKWHHKRVPAGWENFWD